jgi:hypothetical protein
MRNGRRFRTLLARVLPVLALGAGTLVTARASAQEAQQPLPPLPSQQPQYAPPPQQPYYQQQPQYYQSPPPPPPGYGQQPYYQPQPYYAPPPPRMYYEPPPPPEPPTHAPKFSLWTGVRLGYLGFGGGFYGVTVPTDNVNTHTETTGSLVTNGPTFQADVGVRLAKRYVPFVFWEHSFLRPGHRFEGNPNASAYSELYGIGFRYTAGDVDSAGFLTEISIGERTVAVSDGSSTYKMQALEFFKLGLGAEIRLSTLFVLSPLASISTGSMTDTQGDVTYSNAGDGNKHPPFVNGNTIDDSRGYVMVSITCGAHFDVFGK